jgi:hypothetical protein
LTHYDYGFRIYNPAIGRFLSVDPLTKSYPWYTPYQFAGNKPIWAIDLDGLEEFYSTEGDFLRSGENELSNKIFIEDANGSTVSATLHDLLVLQTENGKPLSDKVFTIIRNQKISKIYDGEVFLGLGRGGMLGAQSDKVEGKTYAKLMIRPEFIDRIVEAKGDAISLHLDYSILLIAHEYLHLAQRAYESAGPHLNDYRKGQSAREVLAYHFVLFPNSSKSLDITGFKRGETNKFNELPSEKLKAYYANGATLYMSRLSNSERENYKGFIDEINGVINELKDNGWNFPDANPSNNVFEHGSKFRDANKNKYE